MTHMPFQPRRGHRSTWAWALLVGVVSVLLVGLVGVQPSQAQNPTPPWYMYDSAPGNGFPPAAPYEGSTPNAVVVEGLGSLGCMYPQGNIEYYSFLWDYLHYQVVIEISPQSSCGTLGQYETLISQIKSYMETNGPE